MSAALLYPSKVSSPVVRCANCQGSLRAWAARSAFASLDSRPTVINRLRQRSGPASSLLPIRGSAKIHRCGPNRLTLIGFDRAASDTICSPAVLTVHARTGIGKHAGHNPVRELLPLNPTSPSLEHHLGHSWTKWLMCSPRCFPSGYELIVLGTPLYRSAEHRQKKPLIRCCTSHDVALQVCLGAAIGISRPESVAWCTSGLFTSLLGFLMLSMGLTLTFDDFKKASCLQLTQHSCNMP